MPTRTALTPRDLSLTLFVVLAWALSFPVTEGALSALPPLLVGGLRFVFVSVGCLFVPRPALPWRWIAVIGLFLSTGQYGLLYLGMAAGMPSGLAALVVQAQVPLTILVSAVALRERPTARRVAGLVISSLGLGLVGLTRGGAVPLSALFMVLGAGASWAIGNVCMRVAPFAEKRADNGFRLIVWSALIPPIPLLALSLTQRVPGRGRGLHAEWAALTVAGPRAWLALGYMVVLGTIAAMSIWSSLLARYPADRVTPFALAIPVCALFLSRILIDESISGQTLGACAVVLAGLALTALPPRRPAGYGEGDPSGTDTSAGAEVAAVAVAVTTVRSGAETSGAGPEPADAGGASVVVG